MLLENGWLGCGRPMKVDLSLDIGGSGVVPKGQLLVNSSLTFEELDRGEENRILVELKKGGGGGNDEGEDEEEDLSDNNGEKSKKRKKKHSIPPPFLLTCLVTQPATKSSLSSFRSRNTTTDAPDAPGGFVMARLITT